MYSITALAKIAHVYHQFISSHTSSLSFISLLIPIVIIYVLVNTVSVMDTTRGNIDVPYLDLEHLDLDLVDCMYIDSYSEDLVSCISDNDMSVMQLNIRGLYGKQDELHRLLNKMGGKNKIDIISLNETWLRSETVNKVRIKQYQMENKIRKGKKGGRVSILIKNGLKYHRKTDLEPDLACLECIVVEIKTNTDSIIVCSAYRAPNTNVKEFLQSYRTLVTQLTEFKKHKGNILIAMDHNLDFLKTDLHPHTQDFLTENIEHDLFPCITKPTRVTFNSATLIDNILASENLHRGSKNYIVTDDISDHYPCITVIPNMSNLVHIKKTIYTRKLENNEICKIKEDLDKYSWSELLPTLCCNEAFNLFHQILSDIVNTHSPVVTRVIKGDRKRHDPWITGGILRSLTKQKKLYKKSRDVASGKVIDEYKIYKATLQKIIHRSKQDYFMKKCIEYKSNTKKMWNLINSVVRKSNNKHNIIDCLRKENLVLTNENEIANEFGKYSASIGKNSAEKIPRAKNTIDHYWSKITSESSLIYLFPTNNVEIENIIKKMQPKMSSGHDEINNKLIKELATNILEPMRIIINKSLSNGEFPEVMKLADVSPLHKANCKLEKSNYWPISLLLTLSKVLEKVMYKRTYNYLQNRGLIYKSQYGFRSNHSCELASCELLGEIVKGLENKKHTAVVYLDLSKAFDTLDHDILLRKMERYGIRGNALAWFTSYLTNRKLRAKINTEYSNKPTVSEYYPIDFGTPKGLA